MNKKIDSEKKELVIEAVDICKSFRLYKRTRDKLKQKLARSGKKYYSVKEALKNINFKLYQGQSLGIVGRNGSGKSTLLQIICGTLQPTNGKVVVNKKIAALLELGSGFNPEFTGRENARLNATLLGLSQKQIENRMEKIVRFADIGVFIDQPVKQYSSGMIVRLAFSVIAHVDADILIIDEALAVGDAYFTQKCMRYIQRFREKGTLLFVSHDANAILSLCDTAILLKDGEQIIHDNPKRVLEEYTRELQQDDIEKGELVKDGGNIKDKEYVAINSAEETYKYENNEDYRELRWSDYRIQALKEVQDVDSPWKITTRIRNTNDEEFGGKKAKVNSVSLSYLDPKKREIEEMDGGEIVKLTIKAEAREELNDILIGFILKNDKGLSLLGDNTCNKFDNKSITAKEGDIIEASFVFTLPLLPMGEYSVSVSLASGNQEEHEILHWKNDAMIITSRCRLIASGLAGVPMHSITMNITNGG